MYGLSRMCSRRDIFCKIWLKNRSLVPLYLLQVFSPLQQFGESVPCVNWKHLLSALEIISAEHGKYNIQSLGHSLTPTLCIFVQDMYDGKCQKSWTSAFFDVLEGTDQLYVCTAYGDCKRSKGHSGQVRNCKLGSWIPSLGASSKMSHPTHWQSKLFLSFPDQNAFSLLIVPNRYSSV